MITSKLKFLVDVGVGRKVEEYLLEKRYDIKVVRSFFVCIKIRNSDSGN